MKPTDTLIRNEGNIQGDAIAMSIDTTALAHIMSVLTSLYSDDELAIIREYSTNAWDSHVLKGVTRPIEVYLPSTFNQSLRIRDFGIGLSKEDIVNIYSKYGASSKRQSDEFNGMLGLGCKSALSYTSQFTLVGIKNGIKASVLIHKTDEGAGQMTVLDERPTDEPDGVEVNIPIQRYNNIKSKAENFFSYWPDGSVLLDGREPLKFEGTLIYEDNEKKIYHSDSYGEDGIVMGNVLYPAELNNVGATGRIVVFAQIGSVVFTPSREELQYTEKTKKFVDACQSIVLERLLETANKEIAAASTPFEAHKIYANWRYKLQSKATFLTQEFRGVAFPSTKQIYSHGHFVYSKHDQKVSWSEWSNSINLHNAEKIRFITGFSQDKPSAWDRKKMAVWFQQNNPNGYIVHVFTTDENIETIKNWAYEYEEIAWTDIKSTKLTDNVREKTKPQWMVYNGGGFFPDRNLQNKNVVYIKFSDNSKYLDVKDGINGYLMKHNLKLVRVQKSLEEEFHDTFTNAVEFSEHIKTELDREKNELTQFLWHGMIVSTFDTNVLKSLLQNGCDSLDDPVLQDALRIVKTRPASDPLGSIHRMENILGLQWSQYPESSIFTQGRYHTIGYYWRSARYAEHYYDIQVLINHKYNKRTI